MQIRCFVFLAPHTQLMLPKTQEYKYPNLGHKALRREDRMSKREQLVEVIKLKKKIPLDCQKQRKYKPYQYFQVLRFYCGPPDHETFYQLKMHCVDMKRISVFKTVNLCSLPRFRFMACAHFKQVTRNLSPKVSDSKDR